MTNINQATPDLTKLEGFRIVRSEEPVWPVEFRSGVERLLHYLAHDALLVEPSRVNAQGEDPQREFSSDDRVHQERDLLTVTIAKPASQAGSEAAGNIGFDLRQGRQLNLGDGSRLSSAFSLPCGDMFEGENRFSQDASSDKNLPSVAPQRSEGDQ